MALRETSIKTKNHILAVCVRLFLEQGYKNTPISQIVHEADVSVSTFQNIYRTKSGVLKELVVFMFENQFGAAHNIAGSALPPEYTYAIETALQLAITESNENLREIYSEAYTFPETSEYIYEKTADELYEIFGANFPGFTKNDFYELDIGTSGIMHGYMSKKCDIHFPFEKKLERFLSVTLSAYRVPYTMQEDIIKYINSLDVFALANGVIQKLFSDLETRLHFTFSDKTEVTL